MKQILCAALMAAGLSACVAAPSTDGEIAQASASVASEPASGFDEWGTGKELYMYHRVQGTCQALTHAHGRNAAWGLWKLPLAEVTDGGAEENEEGGAFVRLTCIDGTACIGKGALEVTPEHVAEHKIPFETMALARAYTDRVSALRTACGLTP
ncbi:hypothetical protein [Hyphomonas sp.]|uniref:hypothetical protein n=1 Tax=Hyphomonas sp. TaxID=87 RepID=UPI00333F773A